MSDGTQRQRVEESVSDSLREDLKGEEPIEAEKQQLLEQHEGHLVRDTTSKLAVESPDVGPGMEVEAEAEVPDTYCFTCEEWIGLSGVNLRGTPRSRSEAYYLGEVPMDVLQAKNGTVKTLNELADSLVDSVDTVENRTDALQFIETELEQLRSADSRGEKDAK